ncbi:MAG: hybrid sensor histidine kinase/response regulator [Aestuariivirga sp.]
METKDDSNQRTEATARKCVLIVDDDVLICDVLSSLFANLGYETVTAEDGEAACDRIARANLALAVVDLNMPKLDGFGLLRHIRQHPRTVDLPVIISTGYDDRTSIEEAYRLGASSFVTKPINWAQFGYHAQFVIRNGVIVRDLRRAEAEAVAASKMKNGLFRILSHELKTPLVALIGLTDVLSEALKDKVEAIEAEQLGHIVGASQRLNRLISDILVLSKSFSGASSLNITTESMTDLLDDSIIGLEANAKAKSINIKITRPSKNLTLRCDSQLLRQAIKKLVDNAIKFSPEGGTIEIWAHRKPDHSTVISVRDNGPGIAPAKLAECLQPFIQEDMSYGRPAEGLGLGLPIVKAIAEAHGGELICQSPPGQGMVAAVWIPDLPARVTKAA